MSLLWSDAAGNGTLVVGGTPADFLNMRTDLVNKLLDTEPFNAGKWQQLDVSSSSAHDTYELRNVSVWYPMPNREGPLDVIPADMPWSEDHFRERVGGKPINPGVQHANWPYHAGQVELHQHGGKYDHNYMERIWPTGLPMTVWTDSHMGPGYQDENIVPFMGYRFRVGDLDDVIKLIAKDPGTRQAYLPIWFPEDTGATEGQRVPCTLGYHFMIREEKLHLTYNMRSCEIYRHFTNDVYMAVRLAEWVATQLHFDFDMPLFEMGQLTMNITSLHGFRGDTDKIKGLTA